MRGYGRAKILSELQTVDVGGEHLGARSSADNGERIASARGMVAESAPGGGLCFDVYEPAIAGSLPNIIAGQ